uniref:Uncharacterized protein n=1 Tax=Physcomitrium patens TaxID=3218 RepID=A0A2K1KWX3_PHYPA|nr:hypothetical protein PHYPA_005245 [Physcomitrium patens]
MGLQEPGPVMNRKGEVAEAATDVGWIGGALTETPKWLARNSIPYLRRGVAGFYIRTAAVSRSGTRAFTPDNKGHVGWAMVRWLNFLYLFAAHSPQSLLVLQ